MRRFPLSCAFALLIVLIGCGGPNGSPADDPDSVAPAFVLSDQEVPTGEIVLVSNDEDSLRFSVTARRGKTRIARYHRLGGAVDSMVVTIDSDSRAPISSFQRRHDENGRSISALVEYGRGFDGQARLTLAAPNGQRSENLRAPAPTLDGAQIPITFSALEFGAPRSATFNYVAPFEKKALPAQIEVSGQESLALRDGSVPAFRVQLRVSGLEERYWFAFDPPHRLLRLQEVTRRRTWTRVTP